MDTSNFLDNNFEFNTEHPVFEDLFSVVCAQDDPMPVSYKKNRTANSSQAKHLRRWLLSISFCIFTFFTLTAVNMFFSPGNAYIQILLWNNIVINMPWIKNKAKQ